MVTVDVSPIFRAVSATTMVAVGRAVSTEMDAVLFASSPSSLLLPAASENLVSATEMDAPVVLFAVGVKVAE